MKILLTGGGTGGHITPILAVAHKLKELQPEIRVVYVGERKSKFGQLTGDHPAIDEIHSLYAGKFRRYYGESWLARITDFKTNFLNIRDSFFVCIGVIQAWFLLGKLRPDLVFLKGGFVGVPIGLAAAARRIPIVTHDSDALPGLANRLVSRWARIHATALPAEYYPYAADKVKPVGVLVEHDYQPVTGPLQTQYKKQLDVPKDAQLLLITGGSSGAQVINEAVAAFIDGLLQNHPSLYVIHQVGHGKTETYRHYSHPRLKILEFMKPMFMYTGAADLIITRAGGNAMAEFGTQIKPCIVVPNPHLTGGHQLKNAERLNREEAACIVPESELYNKQHGLLAAIELLLSDDRKRRQLADNLHRITLPDAAQHLALLLLEQLPQKK